MLFNAGIYQHKTGFEISVNDSGEVMLSPYHPVSLRLSDIFGNECWTQVDATTTVSETEG